jgi:hypothetical protein
VHHVQLRKCAVNAKKDGYFQTARFKIAKLPIAKLALRVKLATNAILDGQEVIA